MNKIMVIKFLTILIVLMLCISIFAIVIPDPSGDWNGDSTSQANTKLSSFLNGTIGSIMVVANIVAVVSLVVIGIMYMLGSPEGKAKIKESMMPYVIGATLVISGSAVLNLISKISVELIPGS